MEGMQYKGDITTPGIYKITSDDYNPTVLPGGGDGVITSQNQLKTVADFQTNAEERHEKKKRRNADHSVVPNGVGATNLSRPNDYSSIWCCYCPSTSWSPPASGDGGGDGDCCDCDCCDGDCGCCDCDCDFGDCGGGDCDCGGLDCGGCDCSGC